MPATTETSSDQDLLDRARAGDHAALDALIRKHANLVYGIALRQSDDTQLAADVSQAVFVVFLRRIGTIKSARALPAWFMQTTRFALLDARRAQRRRSHHERQAARPEHDMRQIPTNSDQTAMLDDAIARLRKTDRTVIALRFLQNRPIDEVAQTLAIAPDAARKRVARALERIKALLPPRDATFSVESALATAAAMTMPAHALESCIALAGHSAAPSIAASTLARSMAQRLAMTKLALAAAGVVVSLAIVGGAIAIAFPPSPRNRSVALATVSSPNASMSKQQALAELTRTYPPPPGQALRVIAYPFSAARNAYVDANYPFAKGANNVRSIGLEWDGKKLSDSYMGYVDQSLDGIVELALHIPWYEVAGLQKIKFTPVHRDFVVRSDASPQQRLDSLAALIAQHTGRRVVFVHSTRKLWCIILHGDTRPAPKNSDGFEVLCLTQAPLSDADVARWVKGKNLPGSTHAFDMEQASRHLAAPFFIENSDQMMLHLQTSSTLVVIAADARLKLTDPQLLVKLQKILDNLQHQIGGQWSIQEREIEVFTLTPTN